MQWTFNEIPHSELPIDLWKVLTERRAAKIAWPYWRPAYSDDFIEYLESNTNIDSL